MVVAITVIAAITLLLVIGAAITPYSIVFAKKHSSGNNNKRETRKQTHKDRNEGEYHRDLLKQIRTSKGRNEDY